MLWKYSKLTNMNVLTLQSAVCLSPAQHVIDDVTLHLSTNLPLSNKVSPYRDLALLARRRVLHPGELRCAAVEC